MPQQVSDSGLVLSVGRLQLRDTLEHLVSHQYRATQCLVLDLCLPLLQSQARISRWIALDQLQDLNLAERLRSFRGGLAVYPCRLFETSELLLHKYPPFSGC